MRILTSLWGAFAGLAREMRWSFLPPLMVYMAAGVSGLTAIVGTFFVKDYLGLSAEFLAALTFWAGIPWALKMPLGHAVDLLWRYKSGFIYLGASLLAASMLIMLGLIADKAMMVQYMSAEAWYVLAALLAPVGYVVQDVVADAMTVEAVPVTDTAGNPLDADTIRAAHTTMQTLGRVAIIAGGLLVSLVNVILFNDVAPDAMQATYVLVYKMALVIPVISVLGVVVAFFLRRKRVAAMRAEGLSEDDIRALLNTQDEKPSANWWILGGSAVYTAFTLTMGLSDIPYAQEIIFVGSMGIVLFLMTRLVQALPEGSRMALVATAAVIFIFRAIPGTGAGASWWQIDVLNFDQAFMAKLGLIASVLTLVGMLWLRRWMAERSILYVVGFLSVVGGILTLPILGMFYGLHEWTAALTGGLIDERVIAVVDTALESPLGQVAMIPMLAWIANSAPSNLKATFFAVMASFTNLALSASSLGTKYLNQMFVITREVKDATGAVITPADYSDLGMLLIIVTALSVFLPLAAILIFRKWAK
ncbi:MAG: hypothetical protein GC134_05600 [Proteobacteria bacterium]|nr:hypothetical protein [Pseudomonadota bacterium]